MDGMILTPNIKGKVILVVDDSDITRKLVEKVYKDRYTVLMASNGREALDIVNTMPEGEIIAILLDLNMPDLNGFAVLDYFRSKDLFEKIPVAIITGDNSRDTMNRVFSYKVTDVLIKPFSTYDVERVVSKMIK